MSSVDGNRNNDQTFGDIRNLLAWDGGLSLEPNFELPNKKNFGPLTATKTSKKS